MCHSHKACNTDAKRHTIGQENQGGEILIALIDNI